MCHIFLSLTVALLPYSKSCHQNQEHLNFTLSSGFVGTSLHAQLYDKSGVTFCRPMPRLKIVIILIYYLLLRSVPRCYVELRRQHATAGSLLHQVGTASTFIARLSFDTWLSSFSCSIYWDDDVRSLAIAFPLPSNISALCSYVWFFDLPLCAIWRMVIAHASLDTSLSMSPKIASEEVTPPENSWHLSSLSN